MKMIGLVTHTMRDCDTGEEVAAVCVPTSPNPTSGHVEIVPVRNIVFTDWSFGQAMSFIVTGGSTGREEINYSRSSSALAKAVANPEPRAGF